MEAVVQITGRIKQSIVDGAGLRYTVFTQGCPHHCEGCQNPETWSFMGGISAKVKNIVAEIDQNPLLQGITLSGGEPLCRAQELLPLVQAVKARGLDVVCFTGYTLEELFEIQAKDGALAELLLWIDVLIDGRFVLAEKDLTLEFRGSKNQRVLDLPLSLSEHRAVLVEKYHPLAE